MGNNRSIYGKKQVCFSERVAKYVFTVCGLLAILAVGCICLYMILKGIPAFVQVGPLKMICNTVWKPTAANPSYGILYIIFSSVIGTLCAVILGVPVGLLTAVFLTEISNKSFAKIVEPAVELLAAIPSVIYGLLGLMILNPVMYQLEQKLFQSDDTHQFTGGANLLSAILVLSIMILPTVINMSVTAIKAVPDYLRAASLAVGATNIQTIFRVTLPAAKSGILTGVVLGIGRALGEAMAINMVAGGSVNVPLPFNSVRFLTTQLVSEMSYAEGLHRQVLYSVGFVLFVFIMLINLFLLRAMKQSENS